jgi:hypothetical protein
MEDWNGVRDNGREVNRTEVTQRKMRLPVEFSKGVAQG